MLQLLHLKTQQCQKRKKNLRHKYLFKLSFCNCSRPNNAQHSE